MIKSTKETQARGSEAMIESTKEAQACGSEVMIKSTKETQACGTEVMIELEHEASEPVHSPPVKKCSSSSYTRGAPYPTKKGLYPVITLRRGTRGAMAAKCIPHPGAYLMLRT